jgi:hypothetical protein
LEGTLPSELGNLGLSEFLGQANMFEGNIPQELFRNFDLVVLRLDQNKLTGTVSNAIGGLNNLQDLRLNLNSLSGNLPILLYGLSNIRKFFQAAVKGGPDYSKSSLLL